MKKLLFILSFAIGGTLNAQYTRLLDFDGATTGSNPQGSLISDGIFLYGMTEYGGINNIGTIFKVMPDGTGYVKLLDFNGATNGSSPQGSLISDGTYLYGMTSLGGTNDQGTIFKIMTNGTGYVKLLDFSLTTSGRWPTGSLISDGTFLYGMTSNGGTNSKGTLFKIMTNGSGFVKLLDLAYANAWPYGSLISDGTYLYGMTSYGGTNNMGTIFKVMTNGSGLVTLLSFDGASIGQTPQGSLFSDGTFLYGMTYFGGANSLGTLIKIKPDGTGYAKLLDFNGTNGSQSKGSFISDGTFLYGMTGGGGTNGMGTIFKIMPNGTGYSKLLDFQSWTTGAGPGNAIIMDGTFLYGMTGGGGTNYMGTVFKFQYTTQQVPVTLPIQGITIGSGQTTCYNATQSITVAGIGTNFVVGNGGSATMIAGQNIIYLPGTNVNPGGHMVGYIAPGGPYCGDMAPSMVSVGPGEDQTPYTSSQSFFRVYPNPTTGPFTLAIKGDFKTEKANVEIYGMRGEKVFNQEITGQEKHELSLSGNPVGIYFIRVISGSRTETVKIIRQ
ncbi:MAG: T9SS type A sorting domain-containing protein [Bacteroidales bacterium]|nr:T9SS type A sorting domain-containing protein [Bacteroidales bacterium]